MNNYESYERDVALITAHALQSDRGMVDLIEFVLSTIQQSLSQVPMIRTDVAQNGSDSVFMFGSKAKGLDYVIEHAAELRATIIDIIDVHGKDSADACTFAVDTFFQVPGLGVVKAGFVAQCLGFNVACIDTHNLVRLGMKPSQVEVRKKLKRATQLRKIYAYVELCQGIGSAKLWCDWCDYVAGRKANKIFDNGDQVSAFHVECVTGDYTPAEFY